MRIIITGSSGMVGEGVMLVCLSHPKVSKVLIINRKPSGFTHPKLIELIVQDFYLEMKFTQIVFITGIVGQAA